MSWLDRSVEDASEKKLDATDRSNDNCHLYLNSASHLQLICALNAGCRHTFLSGRTEWSGFRHFQAAGTQGAFTLSKVLTIPRLDGNPIDWDQRQKVEATDLRTRRIGRRNQADWLGFVLLQKPAERPVRFSRDNQD